MDTLKARGWCKGGVVLRERGGVVLRGRVTLRGCAVLRGCVILSECVISRGRAMLRGCFIFEEGVLIVGTGTWSEGVFGRWFLDQTRRRIAEKRGRGCCTRL